MINKENCFIQHLEIKIKMVPVWISGNEENLHFNKGPKSVTRKCT